MAVRDKEIRKPRGRNVDNVYAKLREDILELRRRPGEVLDEAEISATFGLSRSPVREAIVRLTSEGLAQTLKNRGAIVSRFDIEDLPDYFDAQTLLFRITARLAAQVGGSAAAASLQKIQDANEASAQAGDAFGVIRHNRALHLAIAELAGNSYYSNWLANILDQGQRVMRLYVRVHDEFVPLEQLNCHNLLIEAIRNKDSEAADRAAYADSQIVREEVSRQIASGRESDMKL